MALTCSGSLRPPGKTGSHSSPRQCTDPYRDCSRAADVSAASGDEGDPVVVHGLWASPQQNSIEGGDTRLGPA